MNDKELDIFYAGIAQARAQISVRNSSRGRRPYLEVMFRDPETAEAMRDHFGGVGKIRAETPRYRPDRTNHVWRVPGQAGLDVVERMLPYLTGSTAAAAASALERCNRVA